MARLEKKILGEFRGTIGDVVGKIRNGKMYISARPSHYTKSMKPQEVDKRGRFKVNAQLAKVIRQTDLLFTIWDKEKAPATNAFNKICKVNFAGCLPNRPSVENVITPGGFSLPVEEISPTSSGIAVSLGVFNILDEEAAVRIIMIVSFFDPKDKSRSNYEICRLSDYGQDGLNLIFTYGDKEQVLNKKYRQKTVFVAAVTEDKNGNIVRWSETFAKEL